MKKAQAALEFLTTYGWAILVVTVMIGALAYYGVINPKNMVRENCISGTEFQCEDHVAYTDGTVKLSLRVGIPEGVEDLSGNCSADGTTASLTISPSSASEGELIGVTCPLGMSWTEGDVKKINFDIYYKKTGGSFEHLSKVTLIAKVIPS